MLFARIDHGFNGEGHTFLEFQIVARVITRIVQNLRVFVKTQANTVTAVLLDHRIMIGVSVFGDNGANITQAGARFDQPDGLIEAFLRDATQALGVFRHLANVKHAVSVPMPAIFDDRDVNIQNIAIFQGFVAGDAVADHLVDGGADGFRKAVVIERRRYSLLHIHNIVVTNAVQLVGGYPRFDVFLNHFKYIGCQAAGNPHVLDIVRCFNAYIHGEAESVSLVGQSDGGHGNSGSPL